MVVKVGRSRHADYVLMQALRASSRALQCLGRHPNVLGLAAAAQLLRELQQLQASWSLLSRALHPDWCEFVQDQLREMQKPLRMHLLADRVARWHGRRSFTPGQALPVTRQQLDALGEGLQQESERWRRLQIDVMLASDDLQLVMLQTWQAGQAAWRAQNIGALQSKSELLHHQLNLYRLSLDTVLKSQWWYLRHLSEDAALLLKLHQVDPDSRWRADITEQLAHRVDVLARSVYEGPPAALTRALRQLLAAAPTS